MRKSGIPKTKICCYHSEKDINSIPKERDFLKGGKNFQILKTAQNMLECNNFGEDESNNNLKSYTIIAIVYMSKGLISAESNSTNDPFVKLTLDEKEKCTSVKNNTMNGVLNEKLEFNKVLMDINDYSTWPIFLLDIINIYRKLYIYY